jgi:hypothetical protein
MLTNTLYKADTLYKAELEQADGYYLWRVFMGGRDLAPRGCTPGWRLLWRRVSRGLNVCSLSAAFVLAGSAVLDSHGEVE